MPFFHFLNIRKKTQECFRKFLETRVKGTVYFGGKMSQSCRMSSLCWPLANRGALVCFLGCSAGTVCSGSRDGLVCRAAVWHTASLHPSALPRAGVSSLFPGSP